MSDEWVGTEELPLLIRSLHLKGDPLTAYRLKEFYDEGKPAPASMVAAAREKAFEPDPTPPRHGRGSSLKNWVEWAENNTDLASAAIEANSSNRQELISFLEDLGIIEGEDD